MKKTSQHFTIKEITEGVYAVIHKDGGWHIGNSGIIDLGESTLIFDTGLTPQSAKELAKTAIELTNNDVEYVVNSHYHNDHIRGNQCFPQAKIISTQQTRELIDVKGRQDVESDRENAEKQLNELNLLSEKADPEFEEYVRLFHPYWTGIVDSLPSLTIRLPDVVFSEGLEIHGLSRNVKLLQYSEGHSLSDCVLVLPDDGVLFCGDLLFHECHPYLGDGFPVSWLGVLDELVKIGAEYVVPGHGDVTGPGSLVVMKKYIETLLGLVEGVVSSGGSSLDLGGVGVPDLYVDWVLEKPFFKVNLDFLFRQLD
jgi:glyoxylase-like metal-dependent hydrolase (beta-lactamase superfamily II)